MENLCQSLDFNNTGMNLLQLSTLTLLSQYVLSAVIPSAGTQNNTLTAIQDQSTGETNLLANEVKPSLFQGFQNGSIVEASEPTGIGNSSFLGFCPFGGHDDGCDDGCGCGGGCDCDCSLDRFCPFGDNQDDCCCDCDCDYCNDHGYCEYHERHRHRGGRCYQASGPYELDDYSDSGHRYDRYDSEYSRRRPRRRPYRYAAVKNNNQASLNCKILDQKAWNATSDDNSQGLEQSYSNHTVKRDSSEPFEDCSCSDEDGVDERSCCTEKCSCCGDECTCGGSDECDYIDDEDFDECYCTGDENDSDCDGETEYPYSDIRHGSEVEQHSINRTEPIRASPETIPESKSPVLGQGSVNHTEPRQANHDGSSTSDPPELGHCGINSAETIDGGVNSTESSQGCENCPQICQDNRDGAVPDNRDTNYQKPCQPSIEYTESNHGDTNGGGPCEGCNDCKGPCCDRISTTGLAEDGTNSTSIFGQLGANSSLEVNNNSSVVTSNGEEKAAQQEMSFVDITSACKRSRYYPHYDSYDDYCDCDRSNSRYSHCCDGRRYDDCCDSYEGRYCHCGCGRNGNQGLDDCDCDCGCDCDYCYGRRYSQKKRSESGASSIDTYSLGLDSVGQSAGYVDVANGKTSLFYWYFESRNSSKEDPVVLWLNGGPGCSSLKGALWLIGPSRIAKNNTLNYNPYSWNSNANVIFLDEPGGSGFSTGSEDVSTTQEAAIQVYEFLDIFFTIHPELVGKQLHLAGISDAGHILAELSALVLSKEDIKFDLGSVIIGNGLIDIVTQYQYIAPMLCGKGGQEPALPEKKCAQMTESSKNCLDQLKKSIAGELNNNTAIMDYCNKLTFEQDDKNFMDLQQPCDDNEQGTCYWEDDHLVQYLNQPHVLNVLQSKKTKFVACNTTIDKSFDVSGSQLASNSGNLTTVLDSGIPVLIYAGDTDSLYNWLGNKKVSEELTWKGQEEFKNAEAVPWIVNGKEEGSVKNYKQLTFLRIYDTGHLVTDRKPEAGLAMFNTWIAGNYKLNT